MTITGGVAAADPVGAGSGVTRVAGIEQSSWYQIVRHTALTHGQLLVRASAWQAMRSPDGEAALREFALRGFSSARTRANRSAEVDRDFAQRVFDTYTAAYSPHVHDTAGDVLAGSAADRAWFARTGFAEALARDKAAREADEQHRQEIAQADRDFVALLARSDPGPQVRLAAEHALRNGGADADIREFYASGWMAAAGVDVQIFRLRSQDAVMLHHASVAQLITDAMEAEREALATGGEAAVKARAVAAQAWATTKQKAGEVRQVWLDEQELCLEQARYWQTVVERARAQTGPVWAEIGTKAGGQREVWTTETTFADGQTRHWDDVGADAQAGQDRMAPQA